MQWIQEIQRKHGHNVRHRLAILPGMSRAEENETAERFLNHHVREAPGAGTVLDDNVELKTALVLDRV